MAEKIRRRAGVVCIEDGKLLMVRLTDPSTGMSYLFPPGGAIEPGETPEQAALRETREETGYEVTLRGKAVVHRYSFVWGGVTHRCETHFFGATAGSEVSSPEETVVWQDLSTIETAITYQGELRALLFSLVTNFVTA